MKKEKAIKIYNYVENECGIKNEASATEIVRRLKAFFDNSEYYPVSYTHLDVYKRQLWKYALEIYFKGYLFKIKFI